MSHDHKIHEPVNDRNPWVFRIGIGLMFLIALSLMAIYGLFEHEWITQLAGAS